MPAPLGHPPYNTKGEGGRPKVYTEEKLEELADHFEDWMHKTIKANKLLWWKDWAYEIGVKPSMCSKFANDSKRFNEAYSMAKEIQESNVTKFALLKKLDSGFSKFYLINNHSENWKEKLLENDKATKVVFEVNYGNKDQVEILPQAISDPDNSCSE